MNNMYNLSDIPKINYGSKERYDWKNSIGHKIISNVNNKITEYTIVSYDTKTGVLDVKYDNEIQQINRYIFKNNRKDVAIAQISKEHLYQVGEKINGYFIIEQIRIPSPNHKNGNKVKGYKLRCLNCETELILSENMLIHKNDGYCKYCSPKCTRDANDMWTTNPNMAILLKNQEDGYKYTDHYSMKKLEWVCPDCGNIVLASPNYVKNRGLICGKCSDNISMPEKIMFNILEQCQIDFDMHVILPIKSFMFKGKPYTPLYDFKFIKDNINYLIEIDGDFHNKTHSKSNYTLEDIRNIDKEKDILAKKNGFHLIRINAYNSDFEYIYNNIINSKLNQIFDFSNINKKIVLQSSSSNKVKEVCDYYNDISNDLNVIAFKTKLSYQTVYSYLLIGKKLGWTTYDPSTQISKMRYKNPAKYSIVCNEKSIIFKDVNALVNNSEQIFGEKISKNKIWNYFSDKNGDILGYTFKYIPYKKAIEIGEILPDIIVEQ